MKFAYRPYLIVAAGLLVLLSLYMYTSAAKQNSHRNPPSISKVPDDASNAAEQAFIEQMLAHHADAIGMANIASKQSNNDQVKALAASIIGAQATENTKMKAWYKSWFGKEVPEMIDMPGMSEQSGTMMNQLRSADNIDQAFLNEMIPHHTAAITMAKAVLPQAAHPQLIALAKSIITSQSQEITTMHNLKASLGPSSAAPTTSKVSVSPVTIAYTNAGFDQRNVTVRQDTTVTFVNQRSNRPMWVASNLHPEHMAYPQFDQGRVLGYEPLPKDSTFTFTFKRPGVWAYHDHYDAAQQGTITVN